MTIGRKTIADQTRARLLDLWSGEDSFGRPLGCVTTSFTFDAELFEEQCLARFLSIQSNRNETTTAYLVEREEKLSQCFACVLVDRAHAAPDRSLRWNLLPVSLPQGGVLHAKLTLLVWENCIRILIGSANLTEPGYRRNQEVMAAFDFGPQDNSPPELLAECVKFLNRVRTFAPGSGRKQSGPQAALAEFLKSVERRVPQKNNEAECVLVSLLPGGSTVLKQLEELWKRKKWAAPDKAFVLSPFFDNDLQASDAAARFANLLTTRGNRSVTFSAAGVYLPDGKLQIEIPQSLKKSSHSSLGHLFSFVKQRVEIDGRDEDRALHAKSVWLERDGYALYMIGSSNFTAAGLGLHPRHNIELNVAYLIKDRTSKFGTLCKNSWPSEEVVDDIEGVLFLTDGPNDSAENLDVPVLPGAFGLALYCSDAQGERLELEIGENAPEIFEVYSKDGTYLIDAANWVRDGKQKIIIIPWDARRPPSSLKVRWHDKEGIEYLAYWVVNVVDMSALPPPEELGNLSLDELMEILTSARPLHEIVVHILKRREGKPKSAASAEVDPHKKVDTSQFLLRRMRRVAQALEGMRERLQQPVAFTESLHWRLFGPIGPIALATRLSKEDPEGAAFMITEVASTLRGVQWRPLGTLRDKDISVKVDESMRALHKLASKAAAPPNLAKYVKSSFKELLA